MDTVVGSSRSTAGLAVAEGVTPALPGAAKEFTKPAASPGGGIPQPFPGLLAATKTGFQKDLNLAQRTENGQTSRAEHDLGGGSSQAQEIAALHEPQQEAEAVRQERAKQEEESGKQSAVDPLAVQLPQPVGSQAPEAASAEGGAEPPADGAAPADGGASADGEQPVDSTVKVQGGADAGLQPQQAAGDAKEAQGSDQGTDTAGADQKVSVDAQLESAKEEKGSDGKQSEEADEAELPDQQKLAKEGKKLSEGKKLANEELPPDKAGLRAKQGGGQSAKATLIADANRRLSSVEQPAAAGTQAAVSEKLLAGTSSQGQANKKGLSAAPLEVLQVQSAVEDGASSSETNPDSLQGGSHQGGASQYQQATGGLPSTAAGQDGAASTKVPLQLGDLSRFTEMMEMARLRSNGDMTVQIKTETLGEMQVRVSVSNQAVHATILAQQEETRSLLASQQAALHTALARHNLHFEGLSVGIEGGQSQRSNRGWQGAGGSRHEEADQPTIRPEIPPRRAALARRSSRLGGRSGLSIVV